MGKPNQHMLSATCKQHKWPRFIALPAAFGIGLGGCAASVSEAAQPARTVQQAQSEAPVLTFEPGVRQTIVLPLVRDAAATKPPPDAPRIESCAAPDSSSGQSGLAPCELRVHTAEHHAGLFLLTAKVDDEGELRDATLRQLHAGQHRSVTEVGEYRMWLACDLPDCQPGSRQTEVTLVRVSPEDHVTEEI